MGQVVGVALGQVVIEQPAEPIRIGGPVEELDHVLVIPERTRENRPDVPVANRGPGG